MKLFVDTSAWVAYADPADQWHAAASEALTASVGARVMFVTTDYVLDETITLLLYHAGRRRAIDFGENVLKSRQVELVRVDSGIWEDAWQLFKQYEDKTWAFTDCTSFVVMRYMRLQRAFAFDSHFVQAGFQLWPHKRGQSQRYC
jgi:predicted nucleic acid-binding protein